MDELAVAPRHGPGGAAGRQRPPRPSRTAACRSARGTSSPACARAPAGSAGPAATRGPASAATAAGWPAPAWPRPPTRRGAARRRPTADAAGGGYEMRIAAADIGTGARTALARDRRVRARRGHRPGAGGARRQRATRAPLARGSMGTASWGSAVARAPARRCSRTATYGQARDTADAVAQDEGWARHSFGAQFAEVLVDPPTGEVRVPRLLGVFAAGPHHQPGARQVAVHRRDDHGPCRWRCIEATAVDPSAGCFRPPRPGPVPQSRPARTCSAPAKRSGSTSRMQRTSGLAAARACRRDRHHRDRRRDRQPAV